MPAHVFDVPEARAGSDWLAREGRARQGELLAALLSRFNHDLRTPLNTVLSWTHLLQQGLVDSGRSRHVAEVLARNARDQVSLLDEFVDDGRAVLGVLGLDAVSLAVDDLVAHALERAATLASPHGVTFEARLEATGAVVEGDERRLERLVYRLLASVARRAREGSVVELSTQVDKDAVLVRIGAPAREGDWSDQALLDLRVSTFVAALHEGALAIDGAPTHAAACLRLPLRP